MVCSVDLTCINFIAILSLAAGSTTCKLGYGYPDSCPRPGDPDTYTRCCRDVYTPKCCEERSAHVCSTMGSGWNLDYDASVPVIFCPQPGQSDDMTACSKRTVDGRTTLHCFSATLLGAILGGVFGGILLIGAITSTLCCYMVKTKRWHCVTVRTGHSIKKHLVCSPPPDESHGPPSVAAPTPSAVYNTSQQYGFQQYHAPQTQGPQEKAATYSVPPDATVFGMQPPHSEPGYVGPGHVTVNTPPY